MTPEERSSHENAIALCRTHAKLIDSDELKFSSEKLLFWKKMHEIEISNKQAGINNPPGGEGNNQPSLDPYQEGGKPWVQCSVEELLYDREYRDELRKAEERKRLKRSFILLMYPVVLLLVAAIWFWINDTEY